MGAKRRKLMTGRVGRRGSLVVAGALMLATAIGPVGATTGDEPDHIVHAGAVNPNDPLSIYVYEDYFPRHLRVHKGDWVRWEFPAQVHADQAFHTVTFADPDEVPLVRADEIPGTFAVDERSLWSSGCGRAGQPICGISDADAFVSSGTPILHASGTRIQPFDAIIDLPEGTYTYFCTIHHPVMQGTIEVVADTDATDNPAPEDFADLIAELTEEADALRVALIEPTVADEDGQRVWTVHSGARTRDAGGVGFIEFLPASLEIRPGDAVRWVAGDEVHGVTFPDAGTLPLYFDFRCDFDEPAGGLPGVPVGLVSMIALGGWCPPPATLEFMLTPPASDVQPAPGNAVLTPATYHNSGMLAPAHTPDRLRGRPPGSGEFFPSTFDAVFPLSDPEPFTYRCYIHFPIMNGSITVVDG